MSTPGRERPARPRPRRDRAGGGRAGAALARLDVLEIEIDRLVSGGDGLGRYQGIPIFVPRSAPGDRLRVRLTQRRPDYGRAEILDILEPGPGRRPPPCPHFERCGGCDLQHLDDALQTTLKAGAVCETLNRVGGVAPPPDLRVLAAEPFAYRLRTQLHCSASAAGIELGYFERGSRSLVAVDRCPVCRPELEQAMRQLRDLLSAAAPERIDLAAGDGGALTSAPVVPGFPHGEVTIDVGGLRLAFDARCFFQAHRGLLDDLVRCVVGDRAGGRVFDLYGGVGLFALACARRCEAVTLVEGDQVAVRYARINARRNRLRNLDVVHRAVETWIDALPADADGVIVDPPRAGLAPVVRRTLLERPPRRLTYVSCHPAALARDLGELLTAFAFDSLALLDLFPQTGHMEAVAQLSRRDVV